MNRRVIRFDVRLPKRAYVRDFWNQENRNRFLLRPETEWPLSIDPLVWPSVFFSKIFREAAKFPYGSIEVAPETDSGEYWLNLAEMSRYYEAHNTSDAHGVFVAIELLSKELLNENSLPYVNRQGIHCALNLANAVPDEPPPGSEFLGYDVADASWISGLSNCEYSPEEWQHMRPIWASRLNTFGLLKSLEDAEEFRRITDERVAEHAPFWIYGISRLAGQSSQ